VEEVDEVRSLAWLAHTVGRKRARLLLAQAGSAAAALAQLEPNPVGLKDFLAALDRYPLRLVTGDDPSFPALLREIPDPPLALYLSGNPAVLHGPSIAVVGARRCSRSGAEIAMRFARELAELGFTVVSGLALGVDSAAHHGAVQGGRTAAILGSGLGRIYPASNRSLAARIIETGGLLISEYPPDQPARPFHFPERNRLISGSCSGVLVVEAGDRSGSLITARLALEQGREVMAVPGSISNPASRGCHRLLRDGAALVESVEDVLEALGVVNRPDFVRAETQNHPARPDDPELAALLEQVGFEITTFDALCSPLVTAPEIVAARLVELELAGFVEQVPGGYIRRPLLT
jgi:DNA processing protein